MKDTTLLVNATIYTLQPHQPAASALAVRHGRILAVGSQQQVRQAVGEAEVVDLHQQTVIPGLTDAHIHLQYYSLGLQKVDCETTTRSECLRRVAERAQTTPPGQWILGHGWNQNNWLEGFGTATDLDAAAPHHPVYLTAKSLHAGWANHQALGSSGISAQTADPQGGWLGRDAQGQPDGILYESAMGLVEAALPQPTPAEVAEAIHAAIPHLWQMGLTGVHDFDRRTCFTALQMLHQRGQLGLRVVKSLPLEELPEAAELGLRSGFGDDWLRIGSVKCFADGALGPHTAAMLQAYEDAPENLGMLMLDAETLVERGRLAVENGLSLAVHAIGDRANHEVLNGFARLRSIEAEHSGKTSLRHRIEHLQVLHPDDAGRLAQLGVIASMQPIHATSDMQAADRFWGERAALSYAWREQLRHGACLAFGSDAPVESPNPFWGLHAAVTRRRQDGSPGPQGWRAEQRLTLHEALAGFTTGAAYAAGMEDRLGQLAPGFWADLLVLEQDPFTCPPQDLYQIRPAAVMLGGNWVLGGF